MTAGIALLLLLLFIAIWPHAVGEVHVLSRTGTARVWGSLIIPSYDRYFTHVHLVCDVCANTASSFSQLLPSSGCLLRRASRSPSLSPCIYNVLSTDRLSRLARLDSAVT